jgi:chitinase
MDRRACLKTVGAAFATIGATTCTANEDETNGNETGFYVNGSYPAWGYEEGYVPSELPFELLDLIDISDFTPQPDGTVAFSYPEIESSVLGEFRDIDREDTTIIAKIGGGGGSENFGDAVADENARQQFAADVIDWLREYDLDGCELNWEYPLTGSDDDDENLANLMELFDLLRDELDDAGDANETDYWLTWSIPPSMWRIRTYNMGAMADRVDFAKLQGYNFAGEWSSTTDHHSPLFSDRDDEFHEYAPSVHYAVQTCIEEGFSPEQLNLGVPTFTADFSGVPDGDSNGLGQSFTNFDGGSYYEEIYEMLNNDSEYEEYWDDTAQVPWLYSSSHEEFRTYDNPRSVERKCEYISNESLHGVQFWELMGDTGDYSLVQTAYDYRDGG